MPLYIILFSDDPKLLRRTKEEDCERHKTEVQTQNLWFCYDQRLQSAWHGSGIQTSLHIYQMPGKAWISKQKSGHTLDFNSN